MRDLFRCIGIVAQTEQTDEYGGRQLAMLPSLVRQAKYPNRPTALKVAAVACFFLVLITPGTAKPFSSSGGTFSMQQRSHVGNKFISIRDRKVGTIVVSPNDERLPSATMINSHGGQASTSKGSMTNLIDRVGAAVALLGGLYLLVQYTGEHGLIALVFVLQWSMFYETCKVVEDHYRTTSGIQSLKRQTFQKWWWFATIVLATSFRSLIQHSDTSKALALGIDAHTVDLIAYVMTVIGLVNGVMGMAFHRAAGPDMFRIHLAKMAAYHFALLYLVTQSSFWIMTIQEFGLQWIIYSSLLVIINDSMAYFFGVSMGSRKLFPRLSPKKTIEGFVGAAVSTVMIAIPLLQLVMKGETSHPSPRHAIVIALFVSLVAPFGGFLASAVKRAFYTKDFGTLIPGHGGVLDRFDCHVVTAPFVYLYLRQFLGK